MAKRLSLWERHVRRNADAAVSGMECKTRKAKHVSSIIRFDVSGRHDGERGVFRADDQYNYARNHNGPVWAGKHGDRASECRERGEQPVQRYGGVVYRQYLISELEWNGHRIGLKLYGYVRSDHRGEPDVCTSGGHRRSHRDSGRDFPNAFAGRAVRAAVCAGDIRFEQRCDAYLSVEFDSCPESRLRPLDRLRDNLWSGQQGVGSQFDGSLDDGAWISCLDRNQGTGMLDCGGSPKIPGRLMVGQRPLEP